MEERKHKSELIEAAREGVEACKEDGLSYASTAQVRRRIPDNSLSQRQVAYGLQHIESVEQYANSGADTTWKLPGVD